MAGVIVDAAWWQLPGPSRFVQGVISELRHGKNIVVILPAYAPSGLRDHVATFVRENDLWRWRTADAGEFQVDDPAALIGAIRDRFAPSDECWDIPSAADLTERLSGIVLWIDNVGAAAWPVWLEFLAHYQHGCAGRAEYDRGLICVSVAAVARPHPTPDVALEIKRWEGVVDHLDMTLYLDRAFEKRFTNALHHRVAVSIGTELAGSDAELARDLAEEGLETLCDPIPFLTEFAARRGWCGDRLCELHWHDGACDTIGGRCMPHSAALAVLGRRAEIARRIWRGQVAVFFPFIEEMRLELLPHLRRLLTFPIDTTYGTVDSIEDLEVGQLVHFLRGKRVPPRIWRLLNLLKDMRHRLAHLRPLPESVLSNEALTWNIFV